MTTTRTEAITVSDGQLPVQLILPAAGHGPALVLVHEIFGVNEYVRRAAERLAALGYVVACPELYWRIAPGESLPEDEAGLGRAMELVMEVDIDKAVADCVAAVDDVRARPERRGGVGIAGFCLGGSLAYLAAAECRTDAVVSYYGSSVPEHLEALDRIGAPVLLHFGGADALIPRERVALVEKAAAGRDDVEVHVHEQGGHAFDNPRAGGPHDAEAAAAAWVLTTAFLARHLPVT